MSKEIYPKERGENKMTNSLEKMPVWNDIQEYEGLPVEQFEGEKISIDTILNKKIAILKFNIQPSSFYEGNYMHVQIMDEKNDLMWFSTSSSVLEAQLKKLQDQGNFPVKATIVKVKRYLSLRRA
jgi:hypothetical protein